MFFSGLNMILREERKLYIRGGWCMYLYDRLTRRENYYIWKYIKTLRICEYFSNTKDKSFIHHLLYIYYLRKHNKQSLKTGLIIGLNVFGKGLQLYHTGSIVVNGFCKVGNNCQLHGCNCIGNSKYANDVPTIGDNVRFCVGAKAFGDIYLANNITIAAGAVVTKSFYEEGVTLVGIPARILRKEDEK